MKWHRLVLIMLLAATFSFAVPVVYANETPDEEPDVVIDVDINGTGKVAIGISGPSKATIGAKGTSEVNVDVDEQVDLSIDADETSNITISGQNSIQVKDSIQPSASQSMEAQYNDPGQNVDNTALYSYRNISESLRLLIIIPITLILAGLIAFFAIRHYIKINQVTRLKGETKEGK